MHHPRRILLGLLSSLILITAFNAVQAKDEWLQVRSKNFYLVGNASEKDIKKVGVKLEEFRETFRLVFSRTNLVSSIPTNVIVFKSDSAFKPFKPKRPDGKPENWLAGYFQSGEDVNYIVVSAEGDDTQMYQTIFHEFVHSIINTNFPRSAVPQWFNEGLAEYYSTFVIENDQVAKLGLTRDEHLYLLQQSKLIPLAQLFDVSNRQLHAQGDHSRTIFYAESWALIHYLIQTNKADGLSKFLMAVMNGEPQEKAFQDAFQITYADMESELRKYVSKNTYQYHNVTFKNKMTFDLDMQTSPYGEAETNARLGDLLYHTDRSDDAEPFLLTALKLDPNSSMANTTLGMVKLRQRKFDEAKQYLEKATSGDQKNHLAFYRYAYLLSREGQNEFGMVHSLPPETAEKIRQALKHSIAIAPAFIPSYDLFAFVALVTNEHIDEAASLMEQGIRYQPGNEQYAMRLAELYMQQNKFDQGSAIAAKYANSGDDEVRSRATTLQVQIDSKKKYEQQVAAYKASRSNPATSDAPIIRKRQQEKQMTEEEIAVAAEEAKNRSINEALRKPEAGEKRLLGYLQKVECKGPAITYQIRSDETTLSLTSKDFQNLAMTAYAPEADNVSIGCGADLSKLYALLTYKEPPTTRPGLKGQLVSIEFVPKTFRLLTELELNEPKKERLITKEEFESSTPTRSSAEPPSTPIIRSSSGPPPDIEQRMRDAMLNNIRSSIRDPAVGEKREMAFLQKIECTNKGVFFNMKTATSVLRLFDPKPESLPIRVFTPDLSGAQMGCNASIMDFPAVIIYTDKPDPKLKTAGTILTVDFVPKSFTLN